MAERMGCIYIITNDINDKVYVGQTLRDLQVRYSEHCYDTRSTSSIHQAIQKYGVSHFNIAVLEYVPFSKLDEREQYWIAHYNSYKNGYNKTIGGQNNNFKNYYDQILIVEKNYIVDSVTELAREMSKITSWSLRFLTDSINKAVETGGLFLGYHFQKIKNETERVSPDELEDWIKGLTVRFAGKHIHCYELNKDFDTIAECARYCLDNNLYHGTSRTPIQSIVTAIGKNLHHKTNCVDCLATGLTFEFIPGTTKQNVNGAGSFKPVKIYCPEIDKTMNSQIEMAKYFLDNKIWTGIKLKTAKMRISDVVNGNFPDYKGYTFQKA